MQRPRVGHGPSSTSPGRRSGESWPGIRASFFPLGRWSSTGLIFLSEPTPSSPRRVAEAVSRRCGILLAPTFDYGVWNPGKESYAGSTGVERKTLHRALNELLAKWEDHGIQEFILLTAYQHEPHLDALLMAMTSSALTTVVNLFTIDAGDLLAGSPLSEHGGELETSLMLHLAPTWVQPDQATDVAPDPRTYRRYAQGRVATPPPGSRGVLGFPSRASSEKGKAVFLRYVESLTEVLSNEPSPARPGINSGETQAPSREGQ